MTEKVNTTDLGAKKAEPIKIKKTTTLPENKSKAKNEKRKNTPRARKVEELIELSTKNLTDKEKSILIEYLKGQLTVKENMIQNFKNNSESAFEQARKLEDHYTAMEKFYNEKLEYVDEQCKAFIKAVRVATTGGVQ